MITKMKKWKIGAIVGFVFSIIAIVFSLIMGYVIIKTSFWTGLAHDLIFGGFIILAFLGALLGYLIEAKKYWQIIGVIIGGIYGIIGGYLASTFWIGIPKILQVIFIPQIPSLFLLMGTTTSIPSWGIPINALIWTGIGAGIGYLIDKFKK